MRWFERRFELGLPPDLFPNLIERLRGTPARLAERVSAADLDLTRKDGDRWSVQENVGHLLDLEPLWYGRLQDLLARADELRPADLENRKTHAAGHNEADMAALLQRFQSERLKLVERLGGVRSDELSHSARHPRLGQPMTIVDHCFFVAEHDDHHLARITELGRLLPRGSSA